jgi:hypothetical protein
VGGSTTNLKYINDGETWQDIIQNKFKETGKDVVLANAGIEGASTISHIKSFDWWFPAIPGLNPEYIIFYVGINDILLNSGNYVSDQYVNRDSNSLW